MHNYATHKRSYITIYACLFVMENTKGYPTHSSVRLQGLKWPLSKSAQKLDLKYLAIAIVRFSKKQTLPRNHHIEALANIASP